MVEKFKNFNNVEDFRRLAKRRLPFPVFHYIDGAADDEVTLQRNTEAFNNCDLVPNVLRGVEKIDLSTTIFGKKMDLPFFLSPTALQRIFHHEGELAVGKAAEDFNIFFGISSLSTVSAKRISNLSAPKIFQLYFHKDKALTKNMIDECKERKFDALALTVDTITGGNRERDLRTGFTSPPKFTLSSFFSYAFSPYWTLNYLFREKFDLPFLSNYVGEGTKQAISIGDYFSTMLDQNMSWNDAENIRKYWSGPFCLKGIMSVEDAKMAVKIGASAIMISNHGGRQLDGARAPFDQLKEILDSVGGEIEVICDGGIRRGTHMLKALSLGANACSGGRLYLYSLAAGGYQAVNKCVGNLKNELERNMKLMGCKKIKDLNRKNIKFRNV